MARAFAFAASAAAPSPSPPTGAGVKGNDINLTGFDQDPHPNVGGVTNKHPLITSRNLFQHHLGANHRDVLLFISSRALAVSVIDAFCCMG